MLNLLQEQNNRLMKARRMVTGAFFMVQVVFLVEAVTQAEAKIISPSEMGHQGKVGI